MLGLYGGTPVVEAIAGTLDTGKVFAAKDDFHGVSIRPERMW